MLSDGIRAIIARKAPSVTRNLNFDTFRKSEF